MNPPWLKENSNQTHHWLELSLHCQAGAKKTEIQGPYAERLKVRISSSPIDGKANEELIKWFAKQLGLNAACLELLSGQSSKQKRLKIKSISGEELLRLLHLN